jgi:hypothetical protein
MAAGSWPQSAGAPLRVVEEPRIGLMHARERGFDEARYEFISFVDDDNWVCAEWVATVYEFMLGHPAVGVCGGINDAVFEQSAPSWFDEFRAVYAVTSSQCPTGDISATAGLPGAGMTVRSSAWRSVLATGYRCLIIGRQGKTLTACDDWEICLAIRLAGWRIWREPRLRLRHFLPAGRLNWNYLRKLYRGSGLSSVQLDGYYFLESESLPGWKTPLRKMWQWHMLASIASLLSNHLLHLLMYWRPFEGDAGILEVEAQIGRIQGFWRSRSTYSEARRRVRQLSDNSLKKASSPA